jgi:hypothetical protein
MTLPSSIRLLARDLGLGRAWLRYYHKPTGLLAASIREGGPLQQRRTEVGRRQMLEYASTLPSLSSPEIDRGFRVSFLSGEKYWYQTLFCFYSLQLHVEERITPVIFDDGSMSTDTQALIRRTVPWVEFVSRAAIEARLDRSLPAKRFPSLRSRRLQYPHLRKLTDVHIEAPDWTLVLDSDMLFFCRPNALIAWLSAPTAPTYMQDVMSSYGYSPALLRELAKGPLPEVVNVGLYGLNSPTIDWDWLEFCCRSQLEREGPHYLQEQALTALLLAGTDATPLSPSDYVVMPGLVEGRAPQGVLHHYVAHSKRSYFQCAWRNVAASIEANRVASRQSERPPARSYAACVG